MKRLLLLVLLVSLIISILSSRPDIFITAMIATFVLSIVKTLYTFNQKSTESLKEIKKPKS